MQTREDIAAIVKALKALDATERDLEVVEKWEPEDFGGIPFKMDTDLAARIKAMCLEFLRADVGLKRIAVHKLGVKN
jgi:hypothetical protein